MRKKIFPATSLHCSNVKRIAACIVLLVASHFFSHGQNITLTADQIKAITPEWKGERSADGRPKVADKFLNRLKQISMEEAWGYLRGKGYQNQYENDWMVIRPDSSMVGRVVTAQYIDRKSVV